MTTKRIKAFNALLKELNGKEEKLYSPAKSVLDLFNFQEKFDKTELIQQKTDNFEYIQKMYACTIKNTKERNEFIEKCDSFEKTPILSSGLNSLISEMTPLIDKSNINALFNPDELSNPGLLIAKLMDPNNSQMKLLTEQFRPIIESKIKSGELDPSKITEEISKLF